MPKLPEKGPTKQHHKLAIGQQVNVAGPTADKAIKNKKK